MMRVTRGEARIYPLVNFQGERCRHVDRIQSDRDLQQFQFEEVRTDFEFLVNSNFYLKIAHRG